MAGGKAKKAAKAEIELKDLADKAYRRGEKLKKSLIEIIAQTEAHPKHAANILLKALEQNLDQLHARGENGQQNEGSSTEVVEPDQKPTRSRSSKKSNGAVGATKVAPPARIRRTKAMGSVGAETSGP